MQSNATDHVNLAARWATGGQAPSTAGTSPLAFFDLIMDSAREATRSGAFQPLPRLESAHRSAPAPDSHLDEEDDDTPRQATAEDFPGRDLPLGLTPQAQNQPAESQSKVSDTSTDEAAAAEISSEAIAQADAAESSEESGESGKPAEERRLSGEQRAPRQEVTPTRGQPTGNEPVHAHDNRPLETTATADQTVGTEGAALASERDATKEDSDNRQLTLAAEQARAEAQTAREARQMEQSRRDGVINDRLTATENQREEDHQRQADLAAEMDRSEREPAELRATRRTSAKVDPAGGQDKAETPNQQAAAEQATGKPPLTETPGSHQAEAARGTVPVATGVETAKAVTGVEQGRTAEGSAGDGVLSLVQRGIQRGLIKSSSTPQPANPVDIRQQMRMVNRVARAVESTPVGQPVRIRLNPPELGALRIEIRIEKGAMTAKIEAETEVARQLLTENLPQLKERLAESNITIEKFEIELLGKETSGDGQGHSAAAEDRQAQGEGRSRQRGDSSTQPTGEPTEGEKPPSRPQSLDQDSRNLNIVV